MLIRTFFLLEEQVPILAGDRILVQEQDATDGRWFEGHVHVVHQVQVSLWFHGSFGRYSEGRRFSVRFKLSRIPIQRQHQGLDTAFSEDRILFPGVRNLSTLPAQRFIDMSMTLYNPLLASNSPQLQAIASIVSLSPGSPPFMVFGP